ncbi:MAG: cytochrome c-type biogenesis protein CcmH [Xanthomonadales bacterium]|nr:cytochrome c-type biogenesis protein CcmH [Xanthomonadales bacterium]
MMATSRRHRFMPIRHWLAILVLALAVTGPAALVQAAIDPLPFTSEAERDRFYTLAAELRCMVCQNQSLADSDAPLARDLRRELFELMQSGRSDAEIKTYLTERYGDFVLYRPPLDRRTWWLWFGPGILAVIGLVAVALIVRSRRRQSDAAKLRPLEEETW